LRVRKLIIKIKARSFAIQYFKKVILFLLCIARRNNCKQQNVTNIFPDLCFDAYSRFEI